MINQLIIYFADLSKFEHPSASHNESVIGVRRIGAIGRKLLESSDDDDDDDFERPVNRSPPVQRVKSKPMRRLPRCDFVADECDVSEADECSADEDENGVSSMLDSLICDDVEQPPSATMRAHYMQSVR